MLLHLLSHGAAALITATLWWYLQAASAFVVIPLSIATGVVLSHLIHEWGHFSGALLSQSRYTLKKKISPLFFDFDYVHNNARQYLWLSAGGPLGNVLLLILITAFCSLNHLAAQWLLATVIGQFIYVLVLEGPVTLGILRGGNPLDVLAKHFGQGKLLFQRSLAIGVVSGLLVAACLTL